VPVVLFRKAYWEKTVNFPALVEEDMISAEDCHLFDYADSAEEAWALLTRRGLAAHGRD
jgi:predicted Rossmann-fold nucleotide-binding protein